MTCVLGIVLVAIGFVGLALRRDAFVAALALIAIGQGVALVAWGLPDGAARSGVPGAVGIAFGLALAIAAAGLIRVGRSAPAGTDEHGW